MATHTAEVSWLRGDAVFVDARYSRRHSIRFDGGAELAGSSSPHSVPLPYSDASAIDPEEMLVASLSSCHMLWFLNFAAKGGWCVDRYIDRAEGMMGRNAEGKLAMLVVTLRPEVAFSGAVLPEPSEVDRMHHAAHAECFIAQSVRCDVRCEPV
jgi:organic hydroperoxide reductase OsmC/OhrA